MTVQAKTIKECVTAKGDKLRIATFDESSYMIDVFYAGEWITAEYAEDKKEAQKKYKMFGGK